MMGKLFDCLEFTGKYGYEMEYFWISGVFLIVIGFFGFIGNILNLTILFRSMFRKDVIYQLLIVLSFFDILFILSFAVDKGYYSMKCRDSYKYPAEFIAIRFEYIGLIGSIYTTVMVSLERCFVMGEFLVRYSRKIWIYMILIFSITLGYNIQFLFDHEIYLDANGTFHYKDKPWNDETYRTRYYGWAAIFFDDFIPLPIITLLNAFIVKKIRQGSNALKKRTEGKPLPREEVTKLLLTVTTVFLMIRSIDLIFQTLWFFGDTDEEFRRKWMFLEPINDLMLMINSSINFVIYFMIGAKFRYEFLRTYGFRFYTWTVDNA